MKLPNNKSASCFGLLPLSAAFLIVASPLSALASDATSSDMPDGLSAAISRSISSSHTAPIWQVGTPFEGTPRALQAESRKHQMQSWFLDDGVHIVPNCCEEEQALKMRLINLRRADQKQAIHRVAPRLSGERVEYDHPGLVEWYVNRSRGLEQGFDITKRPLAGPEDLELLIDLGADVQVSMLRRGRILIEGSSTERHFTIDGLMTFDADGQAVPSRFETRGNHLAILVDDSEARYPITVDPTFANEHSKMIVGNSTPGANFGYSIHQSGLRAVVGAPGSTDTAGAVYVFKNLGNGWDLEAKLTDHNGEPGDGFGSSVAVTSSSVLVGAWGDSEHGVQTGTVHEFKLNGSQWDWTRQLQPQNANIFSNFGASMKVAGNWLFVGAPNDTVHVPRCGSVQVFEKVSGEYQFSHRLAPSNLAEDDGFGRSLAVNNTQLAVAAPYRNLFAGTTGEVFIYEKETVFGGNQEWRVQQSLGVFGAESFGRGLDWAGERLAVGAPLTDGGGNSRGAVYLYEKQGSTWAVQDTIFGQNDLERLGSSVSMDGIPFTGLRILAGAPSGFGTNFATGIAYIYLYDTQTSTWNVESTLLPTYGEFNGEFGYTTHLIGTSAWVGSKWRSEGYFSKGKVDLFSRSGNQWSLDNSLYGQDRDAGDHAGFSVAIEDGLAVIGVPSDDDTFQDGGSAWVYRDAGAVWFPVTRLGGGENGHALGNFGSSVAIDGETIVVGADQETGSAFFSGSAHVFEGNLQDGWEETAVLIPSDAVQSQRFGAAVAVDGDAVVVGATAAKSGGLTTGAAFVYRKSAPATWSFEQKLTGANSAHLDRFGRSVDILGSVVAVGAPGANPLGTDTGEVRIFRHNGNMWSESDLLVKAHDTSYTNFGKSVALDANRLFVGSPGDFGSKGLAQIYTYNGANWIAGHEFTLDGGSPGDRFGEAVDMEGDRLLVGAPGSTSPTDNGGQAVLFQRSGPDWLQTELVPTDLGMFDAFGTSVAISGQEFLVGAPNQDIDNYDEGASYLFKVEAPDPFQTFGYGDGSYGPCPCGNESPVGLGTGCVNSTGGGASMGWGGTASLGQNDMILTGAGLPANKPAMLFMGTVKRPTGLVLGDGLLGMSGALIRVELDFSAADGTASWSNLHAYNYWIAGETRMFQVWYRDPANGPCSTGFNLSSGVQVSFLP